MRNTVSTVSCTYDEDLSFSRLRGIGLSQYAEMFRANDIDGETLGRLTNDHLQGIGVASFGHRKAP